MKSVNVIVIGVGPHARRIYVPLLAKLSQEMPVKLVGVVDLKSQQKKVDRFLHEKSYGVKTLYFDDICETDFFDTSCIDELNQFADDLEVDGVIIATEPQVHKFYAEWALSRDLHILMDKPISVRKDVSTNLDQAKLLLDDYEELLDLYQKRQAFRSTAFTVNVQRRYEYGFEKVKELISEARDKFNVPITSIQSMHADGTWMFPKEVLTQKSHRHFDGYGKIAHSGFHLFDMVWQLYQAGMVKEKMPDEIEILSSSFNPSGLIIDLNEEDYRNYFGEDYESTGLSQEEYRKKVKNYGEIDSFNIMRFLKEKENICSVSINLLHSSFSRRAWAAPNDDRYKGNGRVKHQQFIIQQGPFQSIQIHNYQSKSSHDVDNSDEFGVGGNNHFDIHVFRNSRMFHSEKPFYKISAKDLEEEERSNRLVNENAKERVIVEFINFILGKIEKADLKSNIDSHSVPVKMMSGVYQSNVHLMKNHNPLIRLSL